MRRIDVWVGRLVAVAGLLYVAIASLWPLSASGTWFTFGDVTSIAAVGDARAVSAAGFLPFGSPPADLRVARVIADVSAARDRRRLAPRSAELPAIGTTSESLAILLFAVGVSCATVAATALRTGYGTKCVSSAPCGGILMAIALNVPEVATVPA